MESRQRARSGPPAAVPNRGHSAAWALWGSDGRDPGAAVVSGRTAVESGAKPIMRIAPPRGLQPVALRELWEYRELLAFLVWRDVKVRYKQTVLGAAWAILQPLLTMVVFSVFFGRLAKVPSDGLPYPLFSYAALVPWTFFANGLTASTNSLVGSSNLIRKVYFPRLVVPIGGVTAGLVDFALAFVVLIAMMMWYGISPGVGLAWLPALLALAFVTSLGVGLWLSALNVRYRDVRFAAPFLVQLWLFATPIAYPSSLLPQPWRTVYGLNPMAGVVEGFRFALLGVAPAPTAMVAVSGVVSLIVLVTGAIYFSSVERTFADVV